jgi:hypothetical protein
MKQHDLCWEDALRALAVSRAVEQVTQETHCTATAVERLTQRLQTAELWKHRGVLPITSHVSRKPSQLLSLHSTSQETRASEILTSSNHENAIPKRDKPSSAVEATTLPIPAEITADFATTTHNNNLEEAKTKSSTAKTVVARKVTNKPESNRKRAAKRSREHEEECSAKRSC